MRMLFRLSSSCLAVALLACVAAGQRYLVHTYTEADGLQSPQVHSVTQDPRGCMWFATRAGVASYDGSKWTSYSVQDGLDGPSQAFVGIDASGALWTVGSITGLKVARLEGQRWHPVDNQPTEPLRQSVTAFETLRVGERDYILVGTANGQLHVWNGEAWSEHLLYAVDDESHSRIMGIAVWDYRLFVAAGRKLEVMDVDELEAGGDYPFRDARTVFPSLPRASVRGIGTEPDGGSLWIVGTNGDGWGNGTDWIGSLTTDGYRQLAGDTDFQFMPEFPWAVVGPDGFGGIYFGNPTRLLYYHPDSGIEAFDHDSGLISAGMTDVHVDREGNVWITGLRGVSKIVSRRFASFTSEHGLFADEVSAVLERESGEIVLGHAGGLTFLGQDNPGLKLADNPLEGRVLDLAEDENGTIWAACYWLGLAEIGPGREPIWHAMEPFRNESVSSVLFDSRGRLWVGSRHLYRLEQGRFVQVGEVNTEVRTFVRRLVEGPTGKIYAATYQNGIYCIDGTEYAHWPLPDEELSGGIFTVVETRREGQVWVGTGAGLYREIDGELVAVGTDAPHIDRPVYMIVEDDDERLWFGTDNGVYRWDGEQLEYLTSRHGLVGAETNRAGGLVDSRGRVWIGMDQGVSVYTPELDRPRSTPPTVEILKVDVGGDLFPLGEEDEALSLTHDENSLIFEFRSIAFVDEDRVRFRVWLEGFDEWWEPPLFQARQVRYTNLPPGKYRLHVRAIDSEGRESAEAVSAPIAIGRPLWRQPWFGALTLALLAAGVFGALKHLAQRAYARRLEGEVRERTGELLASEEATAAEKERLAVTLASIADGVAATDQAGRIVLWNQAAARLMGLSAEDARGRPLARVLQLPVEPVLAQGRVIDETLLIGSNRGEARQLVVSGAPIVGRDGLPTGAVFAFRDVTDKARTEKELAKTERLEALGVLAGGIAHDFNNLLTIVLGGLSLLESDPRLVEPNRGIVRDAEGATHRARSLTNQLLTFSRGGAPVRQAASIADVIRETVSFALRGANVRAEIELHRDLWVVEIDEGQISQVIHNLLINARQAMPEGGTVWVRGRNLEIGPPFLGPGRYVEIQVEDEGPGISTEHKDRVFDPYFSTKEDGSGLGLATAHSIIEKHEGRLTVDSTPDQGATFRIFLPASIKPIAPTRTRDLPARRGTGRILVMDDDHSVRVTIQKMVETLGYQSRGAADGEEALALYEEARRSGTPFDVVLMDLTVPGGLGGKEMMRRLLLLDPGATGIVVSGYSNDPVLADHHAYGFRERLDKPFVMADLARVVDRARAQGTETL